MRGATQRYRSRIVIGAIAPFMSKDTRVLDIGCGNGVVTREIAAHFGCPVVGTDILAYGDHGMPFKRMRHPDVLDFGDGEFDAGLMIDVLHHVPFAQQAALLREARRVCRTVFVFEVVPTAIAKAVDVLINRVHHAGMPVPLTHRTREGWARLFVAEGIPARFYAVKKPSIFYPSTNYLCVLDGIPA